MEGEEARRPQRDDEDPEPEDGVEAVGDEIVRLAAWLQAKEAELATLRARRDELLKQRKDGPR